MCLAIPGKLLEIKEADALMSVGRIAFGGIEKEASLAFLPDAVVGDFVLVHAGFAIAVVDQQSAKRSLDDLDAMAAHGFGDPS